MISMAVIAGVYRLLATDRRFAAGLIAGLLWFKPNGPAGVLHRVGVVDPTHVRTGLGVLVMGCSWRDSHMDGSGKPRKPSPRT